MESDEDKEKGEGGVSRGQVGCDEEGDNDPIIICKRRMMLSTTIRTPLVSLYFVILFQPKIGLH